MSDFIKIFHLTWVFNRSYDDDDDTEAFWDEIMIKDRIPTAYVHTADVEQWITNQTGFEIFVEFDNEATSFMSILSL